MLTNQLTPFFISPSPLTASLKYENTEIMVEKWIIIFCEYARWYRKRWTWSMFPFWRGPSKLKLVSAWWWSGLMKWTIFLFVMVVYYCEKLKFDFASSVEKKGKYTNDHEFHFINVSIRGDEKKTEPFRYCRIVQDNGFRILIWLFFLLF